MASQSTKAFLTFKGSSDNFSNVPPGKVHSKYKQTLSLKAGLMAHTCKPNTTKAVTGE